MSTARLPSHAEALLQRGVEIDKLRVVGKLRNRRQAKERPTVGEAAVVRVTVMPPLAQYQGSVRNGVTSHDFGRFGAALSSGPGVNRRYIARRRVHTPSGGARHYPLTLFRSRRSGNLSTCLRYRVHGLSGTLRNRSRADSAITEVLHVDSDSPR